MKKSIFSYFSYLVLLLLAVGTLSSCDPTETVDAGPSITVNPETAEIEVGQTTNFTYQVVSTENKLQEVRIIYTGQDDVVITTFADKNLYSGTYPFTGQVAGTATFKIEARDTENNVSRKEVTVTVKAAVDPIGISTSIAVILGGQAVTDRGSFVDVNGTTATVYKLAEAKANAAAVDMAYLQGSQSAGQGAVIGSPRDASVVVVYNNAGNGVQTWTVQNNTRFKNTTLTKDAFDAINGGAALTAAFSTGTEPNITNGDQREGSASRVNQLAVNTVFAFRTAGGKDGLAHVASITPGETGSITLNIKVVK